MKNMRLLSMLSQTAELAFLFYTVTVGILEVPPGPETPAVLSA